MEIDYRYECLSGLSADCMFAIGVRYDSEHEHNSTCESWCVQITPDRVTRSNGDASRYKGLWAAPNGTVFIGDPSGVIFQNRDPVANPDAWVQHSVDASITGLWGLRSDYVLAWAGYDEELFRWDGAAWSPVSFPSGWIRSIHGESDNLLYAVGHSGLVARWNGMAWTQVPYPDTTLSSVVVVERDDRVFAAGPGGELLEGSSHGLSKLLHHDAPILSLAWWRDELWVGAADGLHKLVDGELLLLKDNIVANNLDGRGDLLIGTYEFAAVTSDGANFTGYPVLDFARTRAGAPALWATNLPIGIDHGLP